MPRSGTARRGRSKYWILAYRDLASPWGVAAGDHDRKAMLYERQHWRDQGTEASRLKVIGLNDAEQLTVDQAIAELNRLGAAVASADLRK